MVYRDLRSAFNIMDVQVRLENVACLNNSKNSIIINVRILNTMLSTCINIKIEHFIVINTMQIKFIKFQVI